MICGGLAKEEASKNHYNNLSTVSCPLEHSPKAVFFQHSLLRGYYVTNNFLILLKFIFISFQKGSTVV